MRKLLVAGTIASCILMLGAGSAKPLGNYVIEMDEVSQSVVVDLSQCQFTLDRIENGNGSDWAVIEVYNPNDDTIYMVDIEILMHQYPY